MTRRFTAILVCACPLVAQGTWLARSVAHWPPTEPYAAAIGASVDGRMFVHLGQMHETWVYDGRDFARIPAAVTPPHPHVVGCYDTVRNRFVVVSGNDANPLQTWEHDGQTWHQRDVGGLGARQDHALAFDSMRGVAVLFGGNQTFEWNGTSWSQRSSGGPSPRRGHGLAFDRQRGVTVLFGGASLPGGSTLLGDTWEWNGGWWREHFGVPGPAARQHASMAFDTRRLRTILHGGASASGGLNDTWEWNGTGWTPITTNPAPLGGHMAFDEARGVAVVYAESSAARLTEFVPGPAAAASFAAYGTGCAGPAGVPDLVATNGSLPRLGRTLTLAVGNLPASPLNLPFGALGFDNAMWNGVPLPLSLTSFGFTGCTLWLEPVITVTLVNSTGTAAWSLPVPVDVDLVAVNIHVQAAVLAPGTNPGGLLFSNAGHGVIGTP